MSEWNTRSGEQQWLALGLPAATILAVLSGGLVGLLARASDYGPNVVHWVGALGAPWLLAAYLNGTVTRSRRDAAIVGALAIVAGVVAYYVSMWRIEQRTMVDYATLMIIGWSLAGVVIGAPFAVAGWYARFGEGRAASAAMAVLVAALLAEAAYGLVVWQNRYAQAIAVLEVSAAVFITIGFGRTRHVVAYAVPLTVALLVCELTVTSLMRQIGWAGA